MRFSRLSAAALATLFVLGSFAPARGADEKDDATVRAEAAVEYFDKYSKKLKDEFKYADLVRELADHQHPVTAARVGKVLLREKDLERKLIAASTLAVFGKNEEARGVAGAALVKALLERKTEKEVMDTCVDSIGKLPYPEGVPTLIDICKAPSPDPFLLVTTVRAFGNLKDKRALPILLTLWEKTGKGYDWETGEVTVDTGAAGTVDQEAAEAEWQAKYGGAGMGKGGAAPLLKIYVQELAKSVEKIVGERLNGPPELREWMNAHIEELTALGIEIPPFTGPRQPDDKDKKKG